MSLWTFPSDNREAIEPAAHRHRKETQDTSAQRPHVGMKRNESPGSIMVPRLGNRQCPNGFLACSSDGIDLSKRRLGVVTGGGQCVICGWNETLCQMAISECRLASADVVLISWQAIPTIIFVLVIRAVRAAQGVQ